MNRRRYLLGAAVALLIALVAGALLLRASAPERHPEGSASPSVTPGPAIEGPRLVSIDMLDEAQGWAVTETGIARTANGGETWYDVTPPGISEAGYLVLTDFLDANVAWLLLPDVTDFLGKGTLFWTQDGGASWEARETPFGGGSLAFVDARQGWMMADLGAGAGSQGVAIFQSADAGTTWRRTYTNDPNQEGSGESLPLGGQKHFIQPLDMRSAYVGGVIYAPGTPYLFRTDDGGASWNQVPLPLPEGAAESELTIAQVHFFSENVGLMAVRVTGESISMAVYETRDGGGIWSRWPHALQGAKTIKFVSAVEAIEYSTNQFHVTRDAGNTWPSVSPDVQFDESFGAMDWVSTDTGWVVTIDPSGMRALYRTTDGGATWTALAP
jgi:photosystem II stability/assembly factor-like uncharacterized protein